MSDKCKQCGSTEIETDPARGDAVCTNCGYVLEDQVLVNLTTFEETPSGNMIALGQFVAGNSTGGATSFGGSYNLSNRTSRELTLGNARRGITHLCRQLKLSDSCIETSCGTYEIALKRNLTRGRKEVLNHAACVYTTCRRTELEVLLIDISDVLQLDVHELGRAFVKFSQALKEELCIKIPSLDPCLYIMRYAERLEFGDKKHTVSTTAQRLVQRMKRDSIHTGRRPSGVCGAAILISARLHGFNRTPSDVVKVVHVHESTIRKRLMEFGETPSSDLTLDEFMNVDLEEEQDPPSFKAARKRDKDRLQTVDNINLEMDELQKEINRQLEKKRIVAHKRKKDDDNEDVDTDRFIQESTSTVIGDFLNEENADDPEPEVEPVGLGPNIASMNLPLSFMDTRGTKEPVDEAVETNGEFDPTGLDDDELNCYLLTDTEYKQKTTLWQKVNEEYLKEQRKKEEQRLKDLEEGKPEKKKRKSRAKKKDQGPANSAGEAIERMLKEKKLSSKINYDVLKTLSVGPTTPVKNPAPQVEPIVNTPRSRSEPMAKRNITPIARPEIRSSEKPVEEVEEDDVKNTSVEEVNDEAVDEYDEEDDQEEYNEPDDDMSAVRNLCGSDDYDYDDEEY